MDFGNKTIETKRLLLRQLRPDDAQGVFEGYGDEVAMKYWSHTPFSNISQAQKLIENEIKWWAAGSAVRMAITIKQDQTYAGSICLHSFDEMCKRAEIGYLLNQKFWQQGIMSEALQAMVHFAFDDLRLNRLEASFTTAKGKSLGGKVRAAATMDANQVGSLYENDPITITNNTGASMNGYDWFEIEFKGGKAYQWGGIMCSNDVKLDGILEQCK